MRFRTRPMAAYSDVDVATILSAFYDRIDIYSRAWNGPLTVSLRPNASGTSVGSEADSLLKEMQPALVFKGNAGSATVAPNGMPSGISSMVGQIGNDLGFGIGGVALGLVLLGVGIGYAAGS